MSILSFLGWWGPLPLQVVLLWLMIRRGSLAVFPWFFTYTAYSVLATGVRFALRNNDPVYPYVYWGSEAVYAFLGIAVMYEVFSGVFGRLGRLWWFRPIFPLTALLTLGLTVHLTRITQTDLNTEMTWIVGGEMAARILQVAMFVLMTVLVGLFGLRWRQLQFGISAGFGVYATAALFASTKYYEIGSDFIFWWSVISVVSYTMAVLIWLFYFSTPIKAEKQRSEEPPLSLPALERYKEILRRAQRP